MRYASCLTVAPTAMEATLGGSGGITPDPVLEAGREGAKALEEQRQRFWWIRRTDRTRSGRERNCKNITPKDQKL